MAGIAVRAATLNGKPANEFRVDEFKNVEGTFSVVLLNERTGSIVLQANAESAEKARERLAERVDEGNLVTSLDAAIAPVPVKRERKAGTKPPEPSEAAEKPKEDVKTTTKGK